MALDELMGLATELRLLDGAPDAVVVVDDTGRVMYANRQALLLLGYDRGELLGEEVEVLLPERFRGRHAMHRAEYAADPTPRPMSEVPGLAARRKDGSEVPVEISLAPFRDDAGRSLVVATLSDVTERDRQVAALVASEERFRRLFDDAPVGVAMADVTVAPWHWVDVNAALASMLGYRREELLDVGPAGVLGPEDRGAFAARWAGAGEPSRFEMECRCRHADGHDVWAHASVAVVPGVGPGPGRVAIAHFEDVTARKQAEWALAESEARFRSAFDEAPLGMAICSLDPAEAGQFLDVNPAYSLLVGYSRGELLGMHVGDLAHPDDAGADAGWVAAAACGDTDRFQVEGRLRHATGRTIWVRTSISVVRDAAGRPAHTVNHVEDVTDRQEAQAKMAHQALHDIVTGLPNRALLMDRVERALAQLERDADGAVAVLFVDLDRFKTVNDTFGHAVGDQFLVEMARRLTRVVRPPDTVARIGGDEFVVVCSDITRADAEGVAARVVEALSRPHTLDGHEMVVSASIGIALASSAAADPHELVRLADSAMYRAKAHGRSQYQTYTDAFRVDALDRFELEAGLRHAVDDGRLRLLYQPVVDLRSGTTSGVEALLRFQHPTRGLLLPAEFIGLAEESGAIVELGHWAILEACRLQALSQAGFPTPLDVAVNLSARQLQDPRLVSTVTAAIRATGADPARLVVEVTESVYMDAVQSVLAAIAELAELGAKFAIDDFGTGYSSLVYLKRFPLQTMKVDQSFVAGLGKNADDTAIVTATVQLAHSLGFTAVAEGVETGAQHEHLVSLGCDYAQGYYYAEPLTVAALATFLRRPR